MDSTENIRREMVAEINSNPNPREKLEAEYGKENVWNIAELQEQFKVKGFLAPYACVERRSDGATGTVMFQHSPRFYFHFQKD